MDIASHLLVSFRLVRVVSVTLPLTPPLTLSSVRTRAGPRHRERSGLGSSLPNPYVESPPLRTHTDSAPHIAQVLEQRRPQQ
ncbi:hypothetical protein EDB86DRAFT_2870857 [Lactarius hatsudake]|nr:hypothetical protein EDB86DRAFT_2964868 [Lactarius hatsudake]KAH9007246.1 hypothetical protein EDB86DRAFT_2870857 [Lactarius hatsudake]